MGPQSKDQEKDTVSKKTAEVIKINHNGEVISILTSKTQKELLAFIVKERRKSKSSIGSGLPPALST